LGETEKGREVTKPSYGGGAMISATESPAAGVGMLLMLGYAIYWVTRSQRRWRTILYALLSVALTLLLGIVLGFIFPVYAGAFGTLAAFLIFLVMAITGAEHARFTIRQAKQGTSRAIN
jgi:FtsH-binding integral membrane protein